MAVPGLVYPLVWVERAFRPASQSAQKNRFSRCEVDDLSG